MLTQTGITKLQPQLSAVNYIYPDKRRVFLRFKHLDQTVYQTCCPIGHVADVYISHMYPDPIQLNHVHCWGLGPVCYDVIASWAQSKTIYLLKENCPSFSYMFRIKYHILINIKAQAQLKGRN